MADLTRYDACQQRLKQTVKKAGINCACFHPVDPYDRMLEMAAWQADERSTGPQGR
jgi:hypothetical protein